MDIGRIFPPSDPRFINISMDPEEDEHSQITADHEAAAAAAAAKSTDDETVSYNKVSGRFVSKGGEVMTFVELLYKVTSKAANVAKEMLAMTAQNLTDANKEGEAALAWRNKLSDLEPKGEDHLTTNQVKGAARDFRNKYGFDPLEKYDLTQYIEGNQDFNKGDLSKMEKNVESYISTISNNQSKINLDVERYTHVVEEANQLFASGAKGIADTTLSMANKVGG